MATVHNELWTDGDTAPAAALILNAVSRPLLVVDGDNRISYVNSAAEQFFIRSRSSMLGLPIATLSAQSSQLPDLVNRARRQSASYSGYDFAIYPEPETERRVDLQINVVADTESVLIAFEPRALADQISRQMAHQGAVRAASGVASMLAHEIKNPLSGIRGAAQLLEDIVGTDDAALAQLIVRETDRIVSLVDQMEVFSDNRAPDRAPQNIHKILDHVIAIARAGVAVDHRIDTAFDPSLPEIEANWDQMVQVFLNLLINAAEATQSEGGRIQISTAYKHGSRLRLPGQTRAIQLPIEIKISDNGVGVPDDINNHIFDPFVTTKANGKGLGLALVTKIVSDHDGFVDYNRRDGLSVFRVLLPAAPDKPQSS